MLCLSMQRYTKWPRLGLCESAETPFEIDYSVIIVPNIGHHAEREGAPKGRDIAAICGNNLTPVWYIIFLWCQSYTL